MNVFPKMLFVISCTYFIICKIKIKLAGEYILFNWGENKYNI